MEEGPRDLLEEIEISPWSRWKLYGVWPTRLLAQSVLILSVLFHLFWVQDAFILYTLNFRRNCVNLIFAGSLQHDEFSRHGGFDFDAEDFHSNEFVVFNTSEAQQELINVVKNYFDLNSKTVDSIVVADPAKKENNTVPFPRLHFLSKDPEEKTGFDLWLEVHTLDDLGPLAPSKSKQEVAKFVHNLQAMELYLYLESNNPEQWYLIRDSCVLWGYRFSYEREDGAGPFFATIQQDSEQFCKDRIEPGQMIPLMWLDVWLIVSCLWHLGCAILRVVRGISVLKALRQKYHQLEEEDELQNLQDHTHGRWSDVGVGDKLTILNSWNLISIIADLFLLVYAVMQIVSINIQNAVIHVGNEQLGWVSHFVKILLGAGFFFHLISLFEYSEYGLVDYLLLQVNRVARREVVKILVGVVPVSCAYILFGVCMYGDQVSRFGSFENSAVTLFAVMLGDEMWATFLDLEQCHSVPTYITVIYLLSFVMLHLYVVGMSILAVVEEAFISQGLWLLDMAEMKEEMMSPPPPNNRDRNDSPKTFHSSPMMIRRTSQSQLPSVREGFHSAYSTPHSMHYNSSGTPEIRQASGIALRFSRDAAHMLQSTTWRSRTPPPPSIPSSNFGTPNSLT